MSETAGPQGGAPGELFEAALRGYHRRQVEEFAASADRHAAELESRLARVHEETGQLRAELTAAQQAAGSAPAHEELSGRAAQILRLAGEEAASQKAGMAREITQLRWEAQENASATRARAQAQAGQMLTTARKQADQVTTAARAEAEQLTSAARAEAEQVSTQARQHAESSLAAATAEARQLLDEATAQTEAIRDGAGRRLVQLTRQHAETMAGLTGIRDAVTSLVTDDTGSGPLAGDAPAAGDGTPAPHADTPADWPAARPVPDHGKTAGGGPAARTSAPEAREHPGPLHRPERRATARR